MESERFDRLTRVFSSRRAALGGLLGGAAALLGLAGTEDASAHNPVAGCRGIDDPKRRRRCLRRARAHNRRRHSCRAEPTIVTCANRCGTALNNCRKAVACTCPSDKSCLGNGSCNRTCVNEGTIQGNCPAGCNCFTSLVEDGERQCIPAAITECEQVPQVCSSTAECPLGQFCGDTACGPDSSPQNRCLPVCSI